MAGGHVEGYLKNNVKIAALADMNIMTAEAMAKDLDNARCCDDYKALLESGLVDAVSICTPPVAHEEAAIFALEHNIHVLLEKPLAHSMESARQIMMAAERSEGLLMTAFRHRFLPPTQKIREIINNGSIGPVVFFQNIFCGPVFQMKDRWSYDNQDSEWPSGLSSTWNSYGNSSDFWQESRSFLRIQDITLGYSLPSKVIQKQNLISR